MKTATTTLIAFLAVLMLLGNVCLVIAMPVWAAPAIGVLNLFGLVQAVQLIGMVWTRKCCE